MQFKIITLSSKDIQKTYSLMAPVKKYTPLWIDTSSQMAELLPDLIQMNWFCVQCTKAQGN